MEMLQPLVERHRWTGRDELGGKGIGVERNGWIGAEARAGAPLL